MDFVLDDGLMAVHVGSEVGVGLSFEFDGDIEHQTERHRAAAPLPHPEAAPEEPGSGDDLTQYSSRVDGVR